MRNNRRILLGYLCLILITAIVIVVRFQIEQPSPARQTYTFGTATLAFETDRTAVWQVGDCVTLHWQTDNIREIYWSQGPTIGVHTTEWCAAQQVAIPYFIVHLQDGTVLDLAPLNIYTVRAHLLLALLPLAFVACWCFGLHRLLARATERLPYPLKTPFEISGQVHPLLVALFVLLNAVVVWNTVSHSPRIGYDAEGHAANVMALSQGRLPTRDDSAEFFSPPLPYVLPALVSRVSGITETCTTATDDCYIPIRKLGQVQNILVSLVTSFVFARIGSRLHPNNAIPRTLAFFLLAMLPVYYKTFAMMRGEPFVVMFTLLLIDHLLDMTRRAPRKRDAVYIGVYGGMMLLSRQWGAMVLLGVALWWLVLWFRQRHIALRMFAPAFGGAVIAIILGGWFYLSLFIQTGTPLAFNRPADNMPKPASFFTGLGGENVVAYPFSPGYDGQAVPIFYTEMWGDYFGYFYLQRPPIPARLPPDAFRYMGGVNVLSLLPTLVLCGALVYGVFRAVRFLTASTDEGMAHSLFTICTVASFAGFIWFLVRYPSGDADTAKATYLLHVFPLLCLLAGDMLQRLWQEFPKVTPALIVLLVAVAAYNVPILFSRIP